MSSSKNFSCTSFKLTIEALLEKIKAVNFEKKELESREQSIDLAIFLESSDYQKSQQWLEKTFF